MKKICKEEPTVRRCEKCSVKAVIEQIEDYDAEIKVRGIIYSFVVPQVLLWKCLNCGEIYIDDAADAKINEEYLKKNGNS